MTKAEITKILLEYDSGEISTDKAIEKLSDLLSTEAVNFHNWATKEQVSNPNLILSTSTTKLFKLYKTKTNE